MLFVLLLFHVVILAPSSRGAPDCKILKTTLHFHLYAPQLSNFEENFTHNFIHIPTQLKISKVLKG